MAINCSSTYSCPTCGPNCNYECQNGICVEVPRTNVSKTRGVPSQGSLRYGPRGQRQNFRSFTGTNWQQSGRNRETMWQQGGVFQNASGGSQNKEVMKMSVGKLVMGYLGIGLTAFVIGYAIRKGGTAAK